MQFIEQLNWRIQRVAPFFRLGSEGAYNRLKFASRILYPGFILGGPRRTWVDNGEFLAGLEQFQEYGLHDSAERYFNLGNLVQLSVGLEGDLVECGCAYGGSTVTILRSMDESKRLHVFDSFEGLPSPGPNDAAIWKQGDFKAQKSEFMRLTSRYSDRFELHVGLIPQSLGAVQGAPLSFVHLDLDFYDATKAALERLYPQVVPGGVLVCDDYGFEGEVGARRAFDEAARRYGQTVIELSSGQAFLVKRDESKETAA